MKDIKSLKIDELKAELGAMGEKAFRAGQIYKWLHVKLVSSFDEMTDLSAGLREKLKAEFVITDLKQLEVQVSKDDGTRKYLFELGDGNTVESVLMRYHHGNSVCISSQVGLNPRRCLIRSIRSQGIPERGYPMWSLWEWESPWTILTMSAGSYP